MQRKLEIDGLFNLGCTSFQDGGYSGLNFRYLLKINVVEALHKIV